MKKMFVTTGTQFPFERLIHEVDRWAGQQSNVEVTAQTANSSLAFSNIKTVKFLAPKEYASLTEEADVIVGHAGMGTIITGFEKRKPLILMARKFALGEHRNDHQQSTVEKFSDIEGVYIANDEQELLALLDRYQELIPANDSHSERRSALVNFISNIISEEC